MIENIDIEDRVSVKKKKVPQKLDNKTIVGWREWVSLPQLGIPAIKAKIDTGARTSALHAFALEPFLEDGIAKIRFGIHPLQKRNNLELYCVADILEQRIVSDSGGHREQRYVIRTPVVINSITWDIEMTLTNRDTMRFRMLLGRTAMQKRIVVDPSVSYATGRKLRHAYRSATDSRK